MRKRWLTVSSLVLFAVALGSGPACRGEGESRVPGVVVVFYDGIPNGNFGRLWGTLSIIDECLYVMEGDDRVVVRFPASRASWDDEAQTLTYAGHALRQGDFLDVGGSASPPGLTQAEARSAGLDPRCDYSRMWTAGPAPAVMDND